MASVAPIERMRVLVKGAGRAPFAARGSSTVVPSTGLGSMPSTNNCTDFAGASPPSRVATTELSHPNGWR